MNVSFSADMNSTFTAHNGVDVDLAAQARQLPVYQKLIAAIKSETVAIKQGRVSNSPILVRNRFLAPLRKSVTVGNTVTAVET